MPAPLASSPKRLVRYVPKSEWPRLLKAAGQGRARGTAAVYQALVALGLGTGIRLDEALSLNWADIRLVEHPRPKEAKGWVTILHGKGDKERVSELGETAVRYLRALLANPRKTAAADPDAVFVSDHGRRLGARQVQRVMTEIGVRLEMPWLTFHKLRHSHLTELYRSCRDLELVRRQAGHADVRTTTIYLHVADEERGEEVRKLG